MKILNFILFIIFTIPAQAGTLYLGQSYAVDGMSLKVTSITGERESCEYFSSIKNGNKSLALSHNNESYDEYPTVYNFSDDTIALRCKTKSAIMSGLKATRMTLRIITGFCGASVAYGGPASVKATAIFFGASIATEAIEFVVDYVPCDRSIQNPKERAEIMKQRAAKAVCKLARSKGAECTMYD